MGFQLNITQNSTYNYSITGEGITVYSGGTIVSSAPISSGIVSAIGSGGNQSAMMLLSPGGAINIATTLPEDSLYAYQQFITDKKRAMAEGGSASLNGETQIFSGGYVGSVGDHCLLSINGVKGSPDAAGRSCNININPSVSFWAEQAIMTTTDSPVTVLRTTPPCVTCDDYNKLFAAEMILYHAANHVTWRLLNNGTNLTVPGTWYRYEGLVAYWNFLVYKDAFLNYTCSVRENLAVNVGWANPSCDPQNFVCAAVVRRTSAAQVSGGVAMVSRMIFYPGTMLVSGGGKDNNTYSSGDPIPFIIAYSSGNVANGAQVYCGPGGSAARTELLKATSSCYLDIEGNNSSYSIASIVSGGSLITDIQNFTRRDIAGGWILGITGRMDAQQYAAIGYTLSPAAGGSAYTFDADHKDVYRVRTQWWLGSGASIKGPYRKREKTEDFNIYSMQLSSE